MWPPPSSLTVDFWLPFGMAGVYCGAVLALSRRYSDRFLGKVMAGLAPADRTLWHSYIYCIFPGTFCWVLLSSDLLRLWHEGSIWDADKLTNMPPTPGVLRAVGWELGFLAFDFGVMLVWRKEIIEAMQPAMYAQMVAHHVLSIIIWPQALTRDTFVGIVLYLASTEVTSLFINVRWLLAKADMSGCLLYLINGAALVVSFLVVRIIPIPWLLWTLCSCMKIHLSWLEFCVAWLTVPIPAVLNMYWFSFVIQGTIEALFPRKEDASAPSTPLAANERSGCQEGHFAPPQTKPGKRVCVQATAS